MIVIDKNNTIVRLQRNDLTYCKLNDDKETYVFFYGPDKFSRSWDFGGPTMLVEWTDE